MEYNPFALISYRYSFFFLFFLYVFRGTFSRRSKILTGRSPFTKDDELFNYENDSEAEWEEEEEGEDIEMSDGSDSDCDDDAQAGELGLVYDDFFRKDNDFGSDADRLKKWISTS